TTRHSLFAIRYSLPRRQHQPPGAVFAAEAEFLLFEHAGGLAGEVASCAACGVALQVKWVADFLPRIEDVG
ncbi:MAG: hypothetical protein AB1563_13915, partial [Bacillota bacterium]